MTILLYSDFYGYCRVYVLLEEIGEADLVLLHEGGIINA